MEINMKGYNLDSFKEKDIYSWEEIISVIEDLESDLESNYEAISKSTQYGISNEDFI